MANSQEARRPSFQISLAKQAQKPQPNWEYQEVIVLMQAKKKNSYTE